MNMEKEKSILVLSEGPPPLGDTRVEGGGLRAWGLAASLSSEGHNTTYAYRSSFEAISEELKPSDGVRVTQWSPSNIAKLIAEHTHIILRYSMGEMSLFLDNIKDEQILIADCYIPISVEYSARQSEATKQELKNYTLESFWWEKCIGRADYFLYAADEQLHYYLGYLSAVLKLNPASYDEIGKRLIRLPYGYFKKDIAEERKRPKNPSLLWHGAIYPWFNMEPLVEAVKLIKAEHPNFKLIIAGAKNPYTSNIAFLEHYKKSIKQLESVREFTEFIGHTPYHERFSIYSKGSAIITLNKEGLENKLAWRTRLADYIAAKVPIITNGGDPLGERCIGAGVAIRIEDMASPEAIKKAFQKSLFMKTAPNNKLLEEMTWENNIGQLANAINSSSRLASSPRRLENPNTRILILKSKTYSIASYAKHVLKEEGIASLIKKIGTKPLKVVSNFIKN